MTSHFNVNGKLHWEFDQEDLDVMYCRDNPKGKDEIRCAILDEALEYFMAKGRARVVGE